MASRTLRDSGTRFDGRVTDIGASYFTTSDPDFIDVVDRLVARGVVRPWTTSFHVAGPAGIEAVTTGPMRYAAPLGLRSVVEALAEESAQVDVLLDREVRAVTIARSRPRVDDVEVDAVALCMPAPQALRTCPEIPAAPITWEPVIAVTCVYDRQHWVDLDGVFVNDDAVLTWIADDGRRRGDGAPVLVAHVQPCPGCPAPDGPGDGRAARRRGDSAGARDRGLPGLGAGASVDVREAACRQRRSVLAP